MKGVILGFGNMGQNHLERYKKLDTEISAIIDNDEAKRKLAEACGIKTYATLDQYLQENVSNNIDFIDVCLPTNLHFPALEKIMLTFADAPIAILVEKPVVRSAEEADKLEKLAQDYKQIVFVAEVEHYNKRITDFFKSVPDPAHIKLSRMVNLAYFTGETIPWFLDINLSGGIILDLMIHDLSLLGLQLGAAKLLNGQFKQLKFKCTDEATVSLQYPETNCSAEITGSWLSTNLDHPIITTIEITDRAGVKHPLVVDDYLIRGSLSEKDDPFYVEIKTFLEASKNKKLPHSLNEYTGVVRFANEIILMDTVLSHYKLGNLIRTPLKISDGLTNKVFDIETTAGHFVLKVIDSRSPRARSLDDYLAIEGLMQAFHDRQKIPLVLAKRIQLAPVLQHDEKFILVYPFVESKPLAGPIGPVKPSDAYNAGELLGKIHLGKCKPEKTLNQMFSRTLEYQYSLDLQALREKVADDKEMPRLLSIAEKTEAAYQRLRSNMVYSHGDYMPHNILVHKSGLVIIDWELAGLINPDMEFMIGAITFSGYASNEFDLQAFEQFFLGYYETGCRLQHDLEDVILAAIHKCWVNWIAFNLTTDNRAVASAAYQGLVTMIDKADDLKSMTLPLHSFYLKNNFSNIPS